MMCMVCAVLRFFVFVCAVVCVFCVLFCELCYVLCVRGECFACCAGVCVAFRVA